MAREIWVRVRVSNPRNRTRTFEIRAFVHNGSHDSGMPAKLLKAIGVRAMGRERYAGWGDKRLFRRWGEAFFEIQGKRATTKVTFEPNREWPTVGAVTLEDLGFDIDMGNGGLRPFVRHKRPPRRRISVPLRPEPPRQP